MLFDQEVGIAQDQGLPVTSRNLEQRQKWERLIGNGTALVLFSCSRRRIGPIPDALDADAGYALLDGFHGLLLAFCHDKQVARRKVIEYGRRVELSVVTTAITVPLVVVGMTQPDPCHKAARSRVGQQVPAAAGLDTLSRPDLLGSQRTPHTGDAFVS